MCMGVSSKTQVITYHSWQCQWAQKVGQCQEIKDTSIVYTSAAFCWIVLLPTVQHPQWTDCLLRHRLIISERGTIHFINSLHINYRFYSHQYPISWYLNYLLITLKNKLTSNKSDWMNKLWMCIRKCKWMMKVIKIYAGQLKTNF